MPHKPAVASVKYQRSQEALERALDDLKNSEKKLRQVIDTIPTLAWSILPDGSNEFLNKRWHEYTGLSAEESYGSGWQVAIHSEDRVLLLQKWKGLLASGEPGEMEARLRCHDGVFRWFLMRVEPVMGNPAGVRRDFQKLEERRLLGARLLRQGVHPAEVARQVGVHRQSVSRWAAQLKQGGVRALKRAGHAGRRARLRPEDLHRIEMRPN